MNNEIKEMFEQMESIAITGKNKNGIKVDGYGLQQNELKILLDYITNLQKENERLKNRIDNVIVYIEIVKELAIVDKKNIMSISLLLNLLQGSDK